jgi:hypothetical protein
VFFPLCEWPRFTPIQNNRKMCSSVCLQNSVWRLSIRKGAYVPSSRNACRISRWLILKQWYSTCGTRRHLRGMKN